MFDTFYNPQTDEVAWEFLDTIPEFLALKTTLQNTNWHREGSVYDHTRMVVEKMIEHVHDDPDYDYKDILVLAALFHDIGKSVCTVKGDDGLYHSPGHAEKSAEITERLLDTYEKHLFKGVKQAILSLIRYHMEVLYVIDKKYVKNAILELANNLQCIDFESLILLKQKDCEGAIPKLPDHSEKLLKQVRSLFYMYVSYKAGDYIRLEKVYSSNPASRIQKGYTISGVLTNPITVGYRTFLGNEFSTSPVIQIIDKHHFRTMNGIYSIYQIMSHE